MSILRAHKFRIYPNNEQSNRFAQQFGAARWIYNHFLADNKSRYDSGEKHLSEFDCNKEITKLKQESDTAWLKTVDDWVLKNASANLGTAFKAFFSSVTGKRKGPKIKYPRFKARGNRDSFTTTVKVDFADGIIKLPKIGKIKCKFHHTFVGKVKTATVTKTASNKYFVSILVEEPDQLRPATGLEIGIDLGLKDLIILSDGTKFPHPDELLAKAKRELKKQQRKLSRKRKGSRTYEIQRIRLARAHERVVNIRKNYYHNLSRWLVDSFDAIYLENLNVKGMMKNRRLARKIQDAAWSTLVSMVSYKANWAGKTFHQIGRFVPSTKTCSCCGYKNVDLTLADREWDCPRCNTHHDRDINAATNILRFGQLDCYDQILPSVATTEVGLNIPAGLQKFVTKIERSDPFQDRLAKGATKLNDLQSLGS